MTAITKPWERRLRDLSVALQNCHNTYFEPDLLRMNTNHFIQTARTVTFIIQKNKSSIVSYETWYERNVIAEWSSDPVMTWAKEARNFIEKEGDLETRSELKLSLMSSYLPEQDIELKTGHPELLSYGLKRLVRFARKHLPTGVEDGAAIRVHRRWIASSLPDWELLQALRWIYARMYTMCQRLADHLHQPLEQHVMAPSEVESHADEAQGVCFLKLSNLDIHTLTSQSHTFRRGDEPPPKLKAVLDAVKTLDHSNSSIDGIFEYMTRMAEATFNHFGNHVPMLFLFDENWRPVTHLSAAFADQTDKFIFWRSIGERVRLQQIFAIAWTCESWVRQMNERHSTPIRKLPIMGERLDTLVMDRMGNKRQALWSVTRDSATQAPHLTRMLDLEELEGPAPYYLMPVTRAFGLPDPSSLSAASAA